MMLWGFGFAPPSRTSCISSPFQSSGSWKGHQIPQRIHCMKAARDVEVADSCLTDKRKNIRGHSHRHDCYSFYSCEQPWLTLLFPRDSSSFEVLLTSCYLQFFFNLLTMLVKHNLILHSFTLVNTSRSGSTNSYFLSFCQLKEHYKINKYIYTILCHHGQNMDHWVLKLSFIINN